MVVFRWQRHPGGRPTAALRRLAVSALGRLGHCLVEVGVLVCDDAEIRVLNRSYRHKDSATDVLSFPGGDAQPDGPVYLGDIAISLETASRQAGAHGLSLQRELEVLLLHGLIHLAGYDHEADHGEMDAREAELRREILA